MFINRLLDGSGGVVPHTLTLCKDILTRHYEICDGVYGMILDILVGSKYCKKSVKLSDTIRISFCWVSVLWFPGGSVVKNPSASAVDTGDTGSILGLGKAPGEERATCSYILGWEIPWTGAWWTVAHGVKKSQTRLSDWASKLWQSEKAEPGRLEDSPVPEEEGLFNREVPECPPPVWALRQGLAGLLCGWSGGRLLFLPGCVMDGQWTKRRGRAAGEGLL